MVGALGWGAVAHAQSGLVQELRLDAYNPSSPSSTFTFSGYVDFPGSQGKVEIYVFAQGNGDTNDGTIAWVKVKDVVPSNTNTSGHFNWNSGSFAPFVNAAGQNRWPSGGTARLRFRAVKGAATAYLPVQDSEAKLGNDLVLILGDSDPDPTVGSTKPSYLSKKSLQFPVGSWTQENETNFYYNHAQINRTAGPTIGDSLRTMSAFRSRYFGSFVPKSYSPSDCVAVSDAEVTTTYYNRGDLGLGREMHCIFNYCEQELACYVKNFGQFVNNVASAKFGDKAAAENAARQGKQFATVAMVERQWMGAQDANQVLFMAYDAQDNIISGPVQLDNKGFNTFLPGNCMVCHGPASVYHFNPSTVEGAFFLPFDLQAFDYFGYNSSVSRASQETKFRDQNRMIYFSDAYFLTATNHLIDKWYNLDTSSTFIDDVIPTDTGPGGNLAPWSQGTNSQQLYKKVDAKYCRTCHVTHGTEFDNPNSSLALNTFSDFSNFKNIIYTDVCGDSKTMPQAEQTISQGWHHSPRSQILNRLSLPKGCGNQVLTPAPHGCANPPLDCP